MMQALCLDSGEYINCRAASEPVDRATHAGTDTEKKHTTCLPAKLELDHSFMYQTMPDFIKSLVQKLFTACGSEERWKAELLKLIHSVRPSATKQPRIFALWGFANVERRDAVMRVLRYVLKPRLIMGSHVGDNRFEALVMTKYEYDEDVLNSWLECCNMGIDTHSVDKWMDVSMQACIMRIENGVESFGNWQSQAMKNTRAQYQRLKYEEAERRRQQQVFDQTGLHFTTGNMLALFHERNNAHISTSNIQTNYANLWVAYSRLMTQLDETMRRERDVAVCIGQILRGIDNHSTDANADSESTAGADAESGLVLTPRMRQSLQNAHQVLLAAHIVPRRRAVVSNALNIRTSNVMHDTPPSNPENAVIDLTQSPERPEIVSYMHVFREGSVPPPPPVSTPPPAPNSAPAGPSALGISVDVVRSFDDSASAETTPVYVSASATAAVHINV